MRWATLTVLLLAVSAAARPPAGDLDPSFGSGGVAVAQVGELDFLYGLVRQPDGRYVAAGLSQLPEVNFRRPEVAALVRFEADGRVDRTFGNDGVVIPPSPYEQVGGYEFLGVAVQSDGKIVAVGDETDGAGRNCAMVARYDDVGRPDPAFGDQGRTRLCLADRGRFVAVALQPDGGIVAAGNVYFTDARYAPPFDGVDDDVVVRFDATGGLDPTFADRGVWRLDRGPYEYVEGFARQPDGKLLVGGYKLGPRVNDEFTDIDDHLIRLRADGSPDPTFGVAGLRLVTVGADAIEPIRLAALPDGKILAAGFSSSGAGLARFQPDGGSDRSFRVHRRTPGLFSTGLAVDFAGRILATGFVEASPTRFVLARFHRSGRVDRSFGEDGMVITLPSAVLDSQVGDRASTVVTDPNGDVVVGIDQSAGFTLLRYRGSRRAQ